MLRQLREDGLVLAGRGVVILLDVERLRGLADTMQMMPVRPALQASAM